MTMVVAPKPGTRLAARSTLFGLHSPVITSSMLGLGGCGVTRNQMAEARLSQVVATSSGCKILLDTAKNVLPYLPQEHARVPEHGGGECAVVVVPGQLLGPTSVIFLAWGNEWHEKRKEQLK